MCLSCTCCVHVMCILCACCALLSLPCTSCCSRCCSAMTRCPLTISSSLMLSSTARPMILWTSSCPHPWTTSSLCPHLNATPCHPETCPPTGRKGPPSSVWRGPIDHWLVSTPCTGRIYYGLRYVYREFGGGSNIWGHWQPGVSEFYQRVF